MPTVDINNVGAAGFFGDIASYEVPLNGWTDALNVRTQNGSLKNAIGHTRVHNGVVVPPLFLLPFKEMDTPTLIYAGENKIYKTVGETHTNITRQSGGADDDYSAELGHWTGAVLGGIPILNNGTDLPQSYDYTTGKMQDLPDWPTNYTCRTMRAFRNHLFALDVTKGTDRYPHLVKWSHPADPGTVPSSWDETDPSKDAGEYALVDSTGHVVDLVPLRNFAVLYKDDGMYVVQYIGAPYIFSFKQLNFGSGVLNVNCVVEVKGGHFVVTNQDIIWHDGQSYQDIGKGKVQNWMFLNMNFNAADKTFVVHDTSENKVWVCFPTGDSEICNMAVVWDYIEDTWMPIGIPDTAHMAYVESADNPGSFTAWNDATSSWNNSPLGWGSTTFRNIDRELLSARSDPADPRIMSMSRMFTVDGQPKPCHVERVGLPIAGVDRFTGKPVIDLDSIKLVRAVWPKIRCTEGKGVYIRVGVQDVPDGPVRWSPEQYFTPDTMNKLNVLISGRFICFRLRSLDDMWWEFDGYTLDIEVIGRF